jgi:hypothetical protein
MHASEDQAPLTGGRFWATTGFLLGTAVSVAGNIAHTWHPTPGMLAASGLTADQWQPEAGSQAAAAFFPLALLVTVEILSRVAWPNTWRGRASRYGGAALVAGVAAIVSYLHLRGLLLAYGEDDITALLGPLGVDGLMVVSGHALIQTGRRKAAAAQTDDPAPKLPPVVPEYELAVLRGQAPLELGHAEAVQDYRSPRRRRPALAVTDPPARRRRGRRPQTTAAAAAVAPVAPTPAAPVAPPDPELPRLLATAHDRFAEVLATGETPSVNKIRAKLRVGHPRARAIHDALAPV